MGLTIILRDFATWSTVCGVPHIANAKSLFSLLFWTVIFLSMCTIFVVQFVGMIETYLSYPTQVVTELEFGRQTFPAITLCNFNPYRNIIAKTHPAGSFPDEYMNLMAMYSLAIDHKLTGDPYGISNARTTYERDERTRDALMLLSAQFSPDDRKPFMYTVSDLIADCTFGGKTCDSEDFTEYLHPVYGNCLTFNGNTNTSTMHASSRGGREFGLKILFTIRELSFDQGDVLFLPSTQLSGARLAIHQQGSIPPLETTAINVGIGQMTSVSFAQTETRLMKPPYGKCVDRESAETDLYKPFNYTLETCYLGCRQRKAIERCSCINPRYMSTLANTSLGLCTPDKVECLQSLRGNQKQPANSEGHNIDSLTECSCKPPCLERTYNPTISVASYLSLDYMVAGANESSFVVTGTSLKAVYNCALTSKMPLDSSRT